MATVNHILEKKARGVKTIEASMTVYAAVTLLSTYQIGALVVVEGGRPVGIFSERDYARKVILHGKSSKETLVQEIMSDKVAYVTPSHSIDQCMALMTEKRYRHLPVLDGDTVVGIVSIGDLVKETISAQRFIIQELERYIAG